MLCMETKAKKYLLALDQGTTSTRAILFGCGGEIFAMAQREFPQIYPKPGWVEHDPDDIISTAAECMRSVVSGSGISADDIEAVGITNQRETVILWDSESGEPVYNAIVWQCRRSAAECEKLNAPKVKEEIFRKTGLLPDPYFSASKIKWAIDNLPEAKELAAVGRLRVGTVDTYLMYKLSGGKIFATDYTNASRTMLFDINELDWDSGLMRMFSVSREMLPEVFPSGHNYGYLSRELLGREIPICAVAGDQQAALYGNRCHTAGTVKCTFGTGCFLLCNTGKQRRDSRHGLVTTVAIDSDGKPCYALEGSVFAGGAAVQWLRDELGLIKTSADSELIASQVEDSGGVYVVPAFVGLGAPYWDSAARGTVSGITRGTSAAHIVRATLESIAYQTNDVLTAMESDVGEKFVALNADGGASANKLLMQFLADLSAHTVLRPAVTETTALGVAMLAAKVFGGQTAAMAESERNCETAFVPDMDQATRDGLLRGWETAVARTRYTPVARTAAADKK